MKAVFGFKQALEIVMFLIIALMAKTLKGQIPDTLYYQQLAIDTTITENVETIIGTIVTTVDSVEVITYDTTTLTTYDTTLTTKYLLYQARTLDNTGVSIAEPFDISMTGEQVANYAFDLIYRNEQANWMDAARLMKREKLARLYAPVNQIIRDMNGYGFFVMTRMKFIDQYEGTWVANEGNNLTYFTIDDRGRIAESDRFGVAIEGGKTSNINIYTEKRFKITNYFESITNQTYFNKQIDNDVYIGGSIILRKIR